MALSGQSSRTRVCPLLDQSGQTWILGRDGLSTFDPKRTSAVRAMERNPLLGLRVCPLEVRHAQQDYCSNYSVDAVGFDSCYCSVEFNRPID
jgi:hypothetical protein